MAVQRINAFDLGIIALGAALNVSAGYLVTMLKLPLYLDSIGTILISSMCGWVHGVCAGLSSLVILSATAVPTVIAYAGTAVVIAVLSSLLTRVGFMRSPGMTVVGAVIIGLASTLASVPVTTFLYGGVSLAGSDTLTTVFKATGFPLLQSVMMGSLITDVIDKLLSAFFCLMIIKSMPLTSLRRFKNYSSQISRGSSQNGPIS